jgi:hypothetical protein
MEGREVRAAADRVKDNMNFQVDDHLGSLLWAK